MVYVCQDKRRTTSMLIKTNHHIVSVLREECSLPEDILFFIVSFLGLPPYCKHLTEMLHSLSQVKTNLFGESFGLSYSITEDEVFSIQFRDPLLFPYWYFQDKIHISKALLLTQKKNKYFPDGSDAVQLLKESNFQLFDL